MNNYVDQNLILSHHGRNIFCASEWAIIFPIRALPSIAMVEEFYYAGLELIWSSTRDWSCQPKWF